MLFRFSFHRFVSERQIFHCSSNISLGATPRRLARRSDKNGPVSSHLGCSDITCALLRAQPRLQVFGHVHGGYGLEDGPHGISCVNCATLAQLEGELLRPRRPIVLDLETTDYGSTGHRDRMTRAR